MNLGESYDGMGGGFSIQRIDVRLFEIVFFRELDIDLFLDWEL